MEKIDVAAKLARIDEHWSPKVVAELNGQQVKLAKVQGTFVWHHHEEEDELFLVVEGRLRMDFRDRQVWLEPGEMIVVPRGGRASPPRRRGDVDPAVRARLDPQHRGRPRRAHRRGTGEDLAISKTLHRGVRILETNA